MRTLKQALAHAAQVRKSQTNSKCASDLILLADEIIRLRERIEYHVDNCEGGAWGEEKDNGKKKRKA